jgi:FKBP-type peptidyl-prolyl cis-trans isomerase
MKLLTWILAISLLLLGFGCGGDSEEQAEPEAEQPVAEEPAEEPVEEMPTLEPVAAVGGIPAVEGDTITTPSGLRYIDITVGEGATPTQGQTCTMHYTGWLADGTKFDSSHDPDRQAFQFPLGAGRVIRGWDEGIATMKVGGRRLLIIPGELGYGSVGRPPRIPPNSTLVFDVELLSVQ